jgi:hypothetical protein
MPETDGESKTAKRVARKFWFAVSSEIFEHEIVGAQARSPKPADPKRHAWPPLMVWLWLIKEAARQDRQRVIKGQVIPLRRGQVAVSQRYLGREANWGREAVRGFLERLVRHGMIALGSTQDPHSTDTKTNPPLSVVTICNYDTYQHDWRASNPAATQQQPSSNPRLYIETDTQVDSEEVSSSSKSKEEETARPLQLAPSIVEELRSVVGSKRADELVAEYLASPYARQARSINWAFRGWLRKGGIQISGKGDAAVKLADVLELCPRDAQGRPVTALPTTVSSANDWRDRARAATGRVKH